MFHGSIPDWSQLNQTLYGQISLQTTVSCPSVNSLSIDCERKFLLSGGADSSINLWNLELDSYLGKTVPRVIGKVPQKQGHTFGVSTIEWWPLDNGMFVTSSFDGTIKIWDTNTLTYAYSFEMGNSRLYAMDVSPTSQHSLVACGGDISGVRLLDLRSTAAAHTLHGHNGSVLTIKWSPVNENIVCTGGTDGTARIWDIRQSSGCLISLDRENISDRPSRNPLQYRRAHRSSVNGLCWFPRGDYLVTAGTDEKMLLWSLHSPSGRNMLVNFGPLIRNHHSQSLNPIISPIEDLSLPYLFFPSENGEIYIFQAGDGRLVKRLTRGASSQRCTCIVSRGAGTYEYISGCQDGSLSIWGLGPGGKKETPKSVSFEETTLGQIEVPRLV
jgi:DNA excision repair protein ERCC-8